MTIHQQAEGSFSAYSTVDLLAEAVDVLRGGDLVLGDGSLDYAAADMLEALADVHNLAGRKDLTGIDLERFVQVRSFAIAVLDGRWTP